MWVDRFKVGHVFVGPRGPMDKASAYGAGDCRFESCRGHSFFASRFARRYLFRLVHHLLQHAARLCGANLSLLCWAEAPIKIARMTLTIKLDRNWSSFQLANSAPPLSVTDSAIAPSARMRRLARLLMHSSQTSASASSKQVWATRASFANTFPLVLRSCAQQMGSCKVAPGCPRLIE